MKQISIAIAAAFAIVASAPADQAENVTVDGKTYAITSFSRGRMIQLTDTTNGQSAMVLVQGSDYKILSPPGGFFNGVDYRPVIDKVFHAWQNQMNQGAGVNASAVPAGQQPSAHDPNDPNAALRAQNAPRTAVPGIPLANPLGPAMETFDQSTQDGVIVLAPKNTEILINPNGREFTYFQKDMSGKVAAKYVAYFEGGKNPAGAAAKTGKFIRGLGASVLTSENVHADGKVNWSATTEEWVVEGVSRDGKRTVLHKTGSFYDGAFAANTGRDPLKTQAMDILRAGNEALKIAAAKKAADPTIHFDASSEWSQRADQVLEAAVNKSNRGFDETPPSMKPASSASAQPAGPQ